MRIDRTLKRDVIEPAEASAGCSFSGRGKDFALVFGRNNDLRLVVGAVQYGYVIVVFL